jgi:hypothetical protein
MVSCSNNQSDTGKREGGIRGEGHGEGEIGEEGCEGIILFFVTLRFTGPPTVSLLTYKRLLFS